MISKAPVMKSMWGCTASGNEAIMQNKWAAQGTGAPYCTWLHHSPYSSLTLSHPIKTHCPFRSSEAPHACVFLSKCSISTVPVDLWPSRGSGELSDCTLHPRPAGHGEGFLPRAWVWLPYCPNLPGLHTLQTCRPMRRDVSFVSPV